MPLPATRVKFDSEHGLTDKAFANGFDRAVVAEVPMALMRRIALRSGIRSTTCIHGYFLGSRTSSLGQTGRRILQIQDPVTRERTNERFLMIQADRGNRMKAIPRAVSVGQPLARSFISPTQEQLERRTFRSSSTVASFRAASTHSSLRFCSRHQMDLAVVA